MLVSNLDYSDYVGRIALGRIVSGRVIVGDSIVCIHRDGRAERTTVTTLFSYAGLEQVEIKEAAAGDIVGLTGFENVYIGETLTDREDRAPLQFVDIDPPTIRMDHPGALWSGEKRLAPIFGSGEFDQRGYPLQRHPERQQYHTDQDYHAVPAQPL